MKQYCTFQINDMFLGVEATRVQEIMRAQPVTPVPLAPAAVRGLMSLRGQIVTVLDLRCRLGLGVTDGAIPQLNVLVRTPGGLVSLLVDRVGDVLYLSGETFEPVPETLQGPERALIQGTFKLDERLLLALDVDKAVDVGNAA